MYTTRLNVVAALIVALSMVACATIPAEARPAPHITGYTPAPTASTSPQHIAITGSSFVPGLSPSFGSASNVTSTTFILTAIFATSGGITLTVRNPDGRQSSPFTIIVQGAQPTPTPPSPSPLTIHCPAPVSVTTTTSPPTAVNYPNATANGGTPPVQIGYSIASGQMFPAGQTPVTATAASADGQHSSCQFTVTVIYTPGPTPTPIPPGPSTLPPHLLAANVQLVGASTVPGSAPTLDPNGNTFDYGGAYGGGLGYDPVANTHWLVGGVPDRSGYRRWTGEFTIPTPVNTIHPAEMNRATTKQGMLDATGGLMNGVDATAIIGLSIVGGKLYASGVIPYGSGAEYKTTFRSNRDLSNPQSDGPYQLAPNQDSDGHNIPNGFTGGPWCQIPAAYQSLLGGTHLATSASGISIASRLPWGPSAFAFNPIALVPGATVTSTGLLYYPITGTPFTLPMAMGLTDHVYGNPDEGTVWQGWGYTSGASGCFFPDGTKTVAFVGTHGTGVTAYGMGSADPAAPSIDHTLTYSSGTGASTDSTGSIVTIPNHTWAGENWVCLPAQSTPQFADGTHRGCTRIIGGSWANSGTGAASASVYHAFASSLVGQAWELSAEVQVYDPEAVGGPSPHAYPYTNYVWAFDADDLAAVRSGGKKPWQVVPYATWPFALPITYSDAYRAPLQQPSRLSGVAYDMVGQRLFVAQYRADVDFPVIYTFKLVP